MWEILILKWFLAAENSNKFPKNPRVLEGKISWGPERVHTWANYFILFYFIVLYFSELRKWIYKTYLGGLHLELAKGFQVLTRVARKWVDFASMHLELLLPLFDMGFPFGYVPFSHQLIPSSVFVREVGGEGLVGFCSLMS
jgi:hypothetical protein